MKSLGEILLVGAQRFGTRDAVADPEQSLSYAQLAEDSSRLGRALRGLGLEPGDRSCILLPNSVDFIRAHFANLLAGLVSVPCDATLSADTLKAVASSCAPVCLLTDVNALLRLTAVGSLPHCIKHVVLFGVEDVSVSFPATGTHAAISLAAEQPRDLLDTPRDESALATLMYTTGTTGCPKGVQLTHANIFAALQSIVEFVGYSEKDREVVILPLSHNFGLGHVYCNLLSGGAVYTENGLARPGRVLKALESFRATGFPGTPLGYGLLMDNYGPVLAQKGRNLRFSVIDSAPLPPERTSQLQQLLPQLDIMIYYGLTEASRTAFISLSRKGPAYYRSVGRPMKHVEVCVRSIEGSDLPVGETGELLIRGPAVTSGYWANPEESNLALRDGWLHTGDLGHFDADGYLWITGRIKDVINVGGYKVNPADVEKVLLEWPGVRDAGVVGVEGLDGLTGEVLVAAVSGDIGFSPDLAALERHCAARLEKFKVPSRYLVVTAITRTSTGKTKRKELAAEITGLLGGQARQRI